MTNIRTDSAVNLLRLKQTYDGLSEEFYLYINTLFSSRLGDQFVLPRIVKFRSR